MGVRTDHLGDARETPKARAKALKSDLDTQMQARRTVPPKLRPTRFLFRRRADAQLSAQSRSRTFIGSNTLSCHVFLYYLSITSEMVGGCRLRTGGKPFE